ncbi:hypothetical protein FIBSPDRAFT_1006788 [Athelia psychrophila]|uniref:Uncharacterized protein n=1 Tax=Athelia psychrophila TaxID=1759441 RepID=A0A166PA79_9AGAM|nr:hypothetical protein FIBSPDRAFT_1006788 [Fibularhizoctonia sp. CBS 109695]
MLRKVKRAHIRVRRLVNLDEHASVRPAQPLRLTIRDPTPIIIHRAHRRDSSHGTTPTLCAMATGIMLTCSYRRRSASSTRQSSKSTAKAPTCTSRPMESRCVACTGPRTRAPAAVRGGRAGGQASGTHASAARCATANSVATASMKSQSLALRKIGG